MSFSYSGDPAMSALDEVRFLCGDTNSGTALLQDEEVYYLLSKTTSSRFAAAMAAEAIAGHYAAMPNMTIDGLSIQYAALQRHYIELADQLRTGAPVTAMPFAGGVSISAKRAAYEDEDRTRTTIYKHMHMERALPTIPDDQSTEPVEPVQGATNL
jgi:hypothetical protein